MRTIKSLTLLLFSIALCVQAVAQSMSVTRFRHLDRDLTANTHGTSELDQNGETAALIKIVTLEKGFTFEGGSLGIVKTVQKNGELWLYVPRYAQKLTITHQTFGVLRDYVYPETIEGGRTYEMLLDIGTGRYVTLNTSRASSDIEIDGQYSGKAPLQNLYLLFGRHTIKATNDRFEGTQEIFISSNDNHDVRVITVDMEDMSNYFGDVTVNVAAEADIYFNNRLVGTGSWSDRLREGTYEVETRKLNCDPVKTQFTVKAQQQNDITATQPTPHKGKLLLTGRPHDARAEFEGGIVPFGLDEVITLPVGNYHLSIWRKGYVTQEHDYTVRHGETTCDTIKLTRITFIKKYRCLSYTQGHLTPKEDLSTGSQLANDCSSNFGLSFQMGYTAPLHKKSIADIMHFGIDWTFIDFTYTRYKKGDGGNLYDSSKTFGDNSNGKGGYHYVPWNLDKYEFCYAMRLGPSITFVPFKNSKMEKLKARIYYHLGYNISLLVMGQDDSEDANTSSSYTLKGDLEDDFTIWGNGLTTALGVNIIWNHIGLGYEYVTRSQKYKPNSTDTFGDQSSKWKAPYNRFYISYNF